MKWGNSGGHGMGPGAFGGSGPWLGYAGPTARDRLLEDLKAYPDGDWKNDLDLATTILLALESNDLSEYEPGFMLQLAEAALPGKNGKPKFDQASRDMIDRARTALEKHPTRDEDAARLAALQKEAAQMRAELEEREPRLRDQKKKMASVEKKLTSTIVTAIDKVRAKIGVLNEILVTVKKMRAESERAGAEDAELSLLLSQQTRVEDAINDRLNEIAELRGSLPG